MASTTCELDTYTRTVVVPVKRLTERKYGLLTRQMKHNLRVRQYAAEHFQKPDVTASRMTYSSRDDLRKRIQSQPDVDLDSHAVRVAIRGVEQNYAEHEKARNSTPPWPEYPTTIAYTAQRAFLFADGGAWYLSLPAKNGDLLLPLDVSDDDYHQQILPDPEVAPDTGRRPGVSLESFDHDDFDSRAAGLGRCSVNKSRGGGFSVHFSVEFEKHVVRDVTDPRYVVGVDRGRNQLFYAALYDTETDHVLSWAHLGGDEIENTMDEIATRVSEFQANGTYHKVSKLRNRRNRYKRQKDFEAANAIVDLAREAREHGGLSGASVAIVLEELSGMNRLGNYARENRRFNEWSHYRLEQAVTDKAEPYDIPVETVKPQFTSQDCSRCGGDETVRSGVHFTCESCGYEQHADANAAVNIAKRFADA